MIIRVTVTRARASREAVTVDVSFAALDGPYAGQSIDKQFVYTHPTSTDEIVEHLTNRANMIKVSLGSATELKDMEFDV